MTLREESSRGRASRGLRGSHQDIAEGEGEETLLSSRCGFAGPTQVSAKRISKKRRRHIPEIHA